MSFDDADRNRFLVTYVDYSFDDFGGNQPPVYPGLATVWGSLARSKVQIAHVVWMKLLLYLCSNVIYIILYLSPKLSNLCVTYSFGYLLGSFLIILLLVDEHYYWPYRPKVTGLDLYMTMYYQWRGFSSS